MPVVLGGWAWTALSLTSSSPLASRSQRRRGGVRVIPPPPPASFPTPSATSTGGNEGDLKGVDRDPLRRGRGVAVARRTRGLALAPPTARERSSGHRRPTAAEVGRVCPTAVCAAAPAAFCPQRAAGGGGRARASCRPSEQQRRRPRPQQEPPQTRSAHKVGVVHISPQSWCRPY